MNNQEIKLPAIATSPDGYIPYGNLLKGWGNRRREVMFGGPYGTGKTRCGFEAFNLYMATFPGSVGVMARKTYEDLIPLLDKVFDVEVLGFDPKKAGMPVRRIGGEKPHKYEYWNGSYFDVIGLNNLQGRKGNSWHVGYITQAEECEIDDWAEMSARLRLPNAPYYQLSGDCNPDVPDHWIMEGEISDELCYIETQHTDNPLIYEQRTMQETEYGKAYLKSLDRLPGIRKLRGRDGEWCGSEGQVYDFNKHIHVVDNFPIPKHWQRICGVDWGISAPAVCLWLAIEPGYGDIFVYRQIYKTGMTDAEFAQQIRDLNKSNGDVVIRYECDPEDPKAILAFQNYGLNAVAANNDVRGRIDAIMSRLRVNDVTGKPRLKIFRDTLVEVDPVLLLQNHHPTELVKEFAHYNFIKQTDKPQGVSHAQDALGYAVLSIDGEVITPMLTAVVDHNVKRY